MISTTATPPTKPITREDDLEALIDLLAEGDDETTAGHSLVFHPTVELNGMQDMVVCGFTYLQSDNEFSSSHASF